MSGSGRSGGVAQLSRAWRNVLHRTLGGGKPVRGGNKGLTRGIGGTILVSLVVLSPVATVASNDAVQRREDALRQIGAANARFVLALMRGDGEALANLYADDAILAPPDHPIVRGRRAIDDFWENRGFSPRIAFLDADSLDIRDEWAIELGAINMTTNDVPARRIVLGYMTVWKRGDDDAWKIARHIWTTESDKTVEESSTE